MSNVRIHLFSSLLLLASHAITDRLYLVSQEQRATADSCSRCRSLNAGMSSAHDDDIPLPADTKTSERGQVTGWVQDPPALEAKCR